MELIQHLLGCQDNGPRQTSSRSSRTFPSTANPEPERRLESSASGIRQQYREFPAGCDIALDTAISVRPLWKQWRFARKLAVVGDHMIQLGAVEEVVVDCLPDFGTECGGVLRRPHRQLNAARTAFCGNFVFLVRFQFNATRSRCWESTCSANRSRAVHRLRRQADLCCRCLAENRRVPLALVVNFPLPVVGSMSDGLVGWIEIGQRRLFHRMPYPLLDSRKGIEMFVFAWCRRMGTPRTLKILPDAVRDRTTLHRAAKRNVCCTCQVFVSQRRAHQMLFHPPSVRPATAFRPWREGNCSRH